MRSHENVVRDINERKKEGKWEYIDCLSIIIVGLGKTKVFSSFFGEILEG